MSQIDTDFNLTSCLILEMPNLIFTDMDYN